MTIGVFRKSLNFLNLFFTVRNAHKNVEKLKSEEILWHCGCGAWSNQALFISASVHSRFS